MRVQEVPTRSILNPTSGFLAEGFTHTLNPYRGCALGKSLCGTYCYAQWNRHHTRGRAWGEFLDIKTETREAYRSDYDRLKRPRSGAPRPLRIYMSSVTEPYPPQERAARRTRGLLEEMVERPPDVLVIQSHTPLVVDDLPILTRLAGRCALQVNITVETDKETLPAPFPRHMFPPSARIAALSEVRAARLQAVGVVSPLLPLDDPRAFAESLERACDRVILDHFLIGDGSRDGLRTRRSRLPGLLAATGHERWARLDALAEVEGVFREVFGDPDRVGISRTGFNAVPPPCEEAKTERHIPFENGADMADSLSPGVPMPFVTIGYGGRTPRQLLDLLVTAHVSTVVDVRLRPDRASMGAYTLSRNPAKGIAHLLQTAGIEYVSLPELGNVFWDLPNWAELYSLLLAQAGDVLTRRLMPVPRPFALLCAEKDVRECHRGAIAAFLVARGSHRLIGHLGSSDSG